MNNVTIAVAKTLANLREKSGLSQEELAARANIHRTYVSQIERGLKSPTLQVLSQIADALNISLSDILRKAEKECSDLQDSD
jgi:transcriptional regulator with XRE-family HTH domain